MAKKEATSIRVSKYTADTVGRIKGICGISGVDAADLMTPTSNYLDAVVELAERNHVDIQSMIRNPQNALRLMEQMLDRPGSIPGRRPELGQKRIPADDPLPHLQWQRKAVTPEGDQAENLCKLFVIYARACKSVDGYSIQRVKLEGSSRLVNITVGPGDDLEIIKHQVSGFLVALREMNRQLRADSKENGEK